jgi:hypothetical protein
MRRRSFVKNILILTSGVLAGCSKKLVGSGSDAPGLIKGVVKANSKGIAGVAISDGYSVVLTDAKGAYALPTHPSARHLFISTPSGYSFPQTKNIAAHYKRLGNSTDFDFHLEPLSVSDQQHQFIIWADPQVRNASDVEKMMAHSVPDVQRLVGAAEPGSLIHGITVGDIAWDDLKLFSDYNIAVEKMGIPFFQCLGNHDMDYRQGGDETSDKTFQEFYGPTYYSFNRGQVHYIVLDDVRYLGTERDYDGYIAQHQLDWLKKDLSFVSKEKLIILCLHIPVHLAVKNKEDLYAILEDRPVHIMSGHTHWHDNVIKDNIYEHNHGTVCGAWWTGSICGDGTPNGYGVYKVNGTKLSWHYQATGESADHQFKIFIQEYNSAQKQVVVNIWNHDPAWKTEYRVDGVVKGSLEQFEGFDPTAYATLLGPDLPKPRGFAEPKETNHLFRAFVPSSAQEVTIMATDRFGKQYTVTQKV